MIRISDIIKMSNDKQQSQSKHLIKETHKQDIDNIVMEAEALKVESMNFYQKGLSLISETLEKMKKDEPVASEPLLSFSKNLIEEVLTDEDGYSQKFYASHPGKDYLPQHSLNVSFLATKIGIWSGFNKSELMELAISGLLHDIGMTKVEAIVQKDAPLAPEERLLVDHHCEYSAQVLKKMGVLSEDGLTAVKNHHLKSPRDKFCEILTLSDIYEAITHARTYKKAKAPHEAIGEIIDKEALNFQPSTLKAFVNNIGIYPVGNWVALSTGEVGLVTGVNKGYPLRPKVNIIFNHAGERNKSIKFLDFMSETYFYIEKPLGVAELEELKLKWLEKNKQAPALS